MFILIGLAFALGALRYERGSLLQMGPGFVPMAVGAALAALGAAVVVKAFVAPDRLPHPEDGTTEGRPPLEFGHILWRPVVLVLAAVLLFAVTFEGLGLLLTVFLTSLIASYGRPGTTVREALLPAVVLTLLSWLIFVVALQQRLPLLGEWLGG